MRILRLVAVLAVALACVGVAASPASAAPSAWCGTEDKQFPLIDTGPDGLPIHIGWAKADYVGSYWGLSGTYRYWHHTLVYFNGGTDYNGGRAVRCNAAAEELGSVDLTKETLTANDHPKCGTTSYSVGSNHYTYIGTRYNDGDKFRYWGQQIDYGQFIYRGPAAVRCD